MGGEKRGEPELPIKEDRGKILRERKANTITA